MALPGRYLARLTVEGKHYEVPLTVKPDPRFTLPSGTLEDQLSLSLQLGERLGAVTQALLVARSEETQLKAIKTAGAASATVQAVQSYMTRLEALLEAPASPGAEAAARAPLLPELQQRLETIYTDVTRSDAAPTAVLRSAGVAALAASQSALAGWQQLQTELPALSARLHAEKLGVIKTGVPLPRDLNVADEE